MASWLLILVDDQIEFGLTKATRLLAHSEAGVLTSILNRCSPSRVGGNGKAPNRPIDLDRRKLVRSISISGERLSRPSGSTSLVREVPDSGVPRSSLDHRITKRASKSRPISSVDSCDLRGGGAGTVNSSITSINDTLFDSWATMAFWHRIAHMTFTLFHPFVQLRPHPSFPNSRLELTTPWLGMLCESLAPILGCVPKRAPLRWRCLPCS